VDQRAPLVQQVEGRDQPVLQAPQAVGPDLQVLQAVELVLQVQQEFKARPARQEQLDLQEPKVQLAPQVQQEFKARRVQ
jgi:hypothetical protein